MGGGGRSRRSGWKEGIGRGWGRGVEGVLGGNVEGEEGGGRRSMVGKRVGWAVAGEEKVRKVGDQA